jgi:hypothetical protein
LQSGCYVDAIAINIVWRCHYVADVYCDPQSYRAQPGAFRNLRSMRGLLDLARPPHCIERTWKLGEDTVPSRFDHPSTVFLGNGPDYLGEQGHPAPMGARLVLGHQYGVANDIRERYRRQPSRTAIIGR